MAFVIERTNDHEYGGKKSLSMACRTNDPYGSRTNDPNGCKTNDPYGCRTNDLHGCRTNDP